jgi:hypothetical protein
VFPGRRLAKCETGVVKSAANAEMLESVSATEADGELRSSAGVAGTAGIKTGEDHASQVGSGGCK